MTPSQLVAALIIVATSIGVAVGRYAWLRMNRATIALTGATALIVMGVISPEETYASLDLDTLTLLFAMMIINVNLRRAGCWPTSSWPRACCRPSFSTTPSCSFLRRWCRTLPGAKPVADPVPHCVDDGGQQR